MKNYYQILGIGREAGVKEIRKAYRNLALKLHPDVNDAPDANERFIELGEAYEVLKNPVSKKRYDRLCDYHFLGKKPPKSNDYRRKSRSWEEKTRRRQKQGADKAKKNSRTGYKSFKKKTKSSKSWDGVWDLLYIIFEFLGAISG